jgi:hypothetical protein
LFFFSRATNLNQGIPNNLSDVSNSSNDIEHDPQLLNPSAMMRGRHPDLFSDSVVKVKPRLSKTVFEYHLDTLTSRKQEYEFEHFSRRLAERLICPNLRIQTGPTGGGDSKVDTETYPVADEVSERWWVGEANAGSERWAFAFSAKKDWKAKAKADVKNVISTGRDYKRIYFFTNQFASDKQRANLEDNLFKLHAVPVHIIDRSWLVAKVYENDCLDIAISTLSIDGMEQELLSHTGENDAIRLVQIQELDKQIADPSRYQGARYQLVEDCLQSALLARGLERSRNEVESRFFQTDRLAEQVGISSQRLRVAYNRAWTSFWWYEDYSGFCKFYDEVEEHVLASHQAAEVERLVTLWQLLPPSIVAGRISVEVAKVEQRKNTVSAILQTIADDRSRPNNALQARTSLLIIKMTELGQSNSYSLMDEVWSELSILVEESKVLGAYPIQRLSNLIQEIGEHIDSPSFDDLYEKLGGIIAQRRSDGEAGIAYCKRGEQKLQHGKPYDAIRWFGRAEGLLIKEEYGDELITALVGSSLAYEQVGLIWAARNKMLFAADRRLFESQEDRRAMRPAFFAFKRIVWIELQVGRIPHILDAMQFARILASQASLSEDEEKKYIDEVRMQEGILSIHLFNIDFDSLPLVSFLPDVLERYGLTNARLVLLVALGQKEAVYAEKYLADEETWEDLEATVGHLRNQPAAKDVSERPVLVVGRTSLLRSIILGTEIIIETDNNQTSFGIAESILGSLEAFLATSNEHDLFPRRQSTSIRLFGSKNTLKLPKVEFSLDDTSDFKILHPIPLEFKSSADMLEFSSWLHETMFAILTLLFQIDDVEAWIRRTAGEERAFARALALGNILTTNRNIFSEEQKLLLQNWIEEDDKQYERLRVEPWNVAVESKSSLNAQKDNTTPNGAGSFNWQDLAHNDRRIVSPIDTMLWGQARWQGVGFGWGAGSPPLLGIAFENGIVGKAIFKAWSERWGREDKKDELRLAIITGVSVQNPAHYAVVIGPGMSQLKESESRFFSLMSRVHHMTPNTSSNLENFLAEYKKFGAYWLMPALMGSPPEFMMDQCILKHHLHIRPAWQIGDNDPDLFALLEDQCPIVPPDITDPPVYKALERLKIHRNRKR